MLLNALTVGRGAKLVFHPMSGVQRGFSLYLGTATVWFGSATLYVERCLSTEDVWKGIGRKLEVLKSGPLKIVGNWIARPAWTYARGAGGCR